jgi:hypothetical protein
MGNRRLFDTLVIERAIPAAAFRKEQYDDVKCKALASCW